MKSLRILNTVLLVIFSTFIIWSCKYDKVSITSAISKMNDKKVKLCINEMDCRNSNADTASIHKLVADYSLVVYVDSSECSPCIIDHMYEWNDFMKETKGKHLNLDFIFIAAPRLIQREDTYLSIESCGLKNNIYVDTAFSFSRNNLFLPKENVYHTFLIDEKNMIRLVGSPLRNKKMKKLVYDLIQAKRN